MSFFSEGYIIVRSLIPNPKELYEYTLNNLNKGSMDDNQARGTPSFYNDSKMSELHDKLLSKIEKLTDLKLFKTYNYYRTYKKHDILRIHTDRPACEISVTMNIGYTGSNWGLWIVNYKEEADVALLEPGDAMIYRGCDLKHWRGINLHADNYSQVFLHFVDQDGPFSEHVDDGIQCPK